MDQPPAEVAKEHFRMTAQPFDAPDDPEAVARIVDHLECDDMLLFATDYPHWQYEDDAVPDGFPEKLAQKLTVEAALKTYSRLED